MAVTIKFKRGPGASIPNLQLGEPGYCIDTKELFIGSDEGNKLVGEGTFLKLSGGTLTGALTLPSAAPTLAAHAANKAYVDNVASGLDVKASVKCVATVNQLVQRTHDSPYKYEYSSNGSVVIDGYTLLEGDRILLVGQVNYMDNGIFVVDQVGGEGTPCMLTRPADATEGTLTGGAFVFVEQGNTYGDTGWVCITDDDPIVIGETLIEFTQFTGAGSGAGSAGRVNFIELDDTPAEYTSNRVPVVNAAGTALVWATKESLGIQKIESFGDFAGSYQGNSGKMLRVNADEESLEYFLPDLTPNGQNGDIPIASSWAAEHQAASNSVHGAPSGANLLHSNSVIDGGTF